MGEKVAVFGAGVAGLTAAHELADRGFEVHVYERRDIPGGKARSFYLPNGLPAEHGFRFFPGFYRHLHDTMERIPYPGEPVKGVRGNLKPTSDVQVLQDNDKPIDLPTHLWRWDTVALRSIRLGGPHIFTANTGLSRHDLGFLGSRLRDLLSACTERRFAEYELEDWWNFSCAAHRSDQYKKMVSAMTRSLVAARAEELSVRTGGYILLQLQLAALDWKGHKPRVLNGPTSTVWIEPWLRYLDSRGVRFHFRRTAEEIHCINGRIREVIVSDDNGVECPVRAHWYVAALPAEIMQGLVTPAIARAEPGLANLGKLQLRWMNGVMLYLRRDVAMVPGHTIYVDSPWALTSISQRQFWDGAELGSVEGVKVAGVLSVDVSDWESNGVIYNKPAKCCTRPEIVREVLTQIRQHLAQTDNPRALDDENILGSFVDEDIKMPNDGGVAVNLEPLLVNTAGSWANRPEAVTRIENLFLASDYVRTYTDLATMEGANEAARRAVNGVLDRSHSALPRCSVWPLRYPGGLFTLFRRRDRSRLRRANLTAFEQAAELIKQLAEWSQKSKP
jgi:uncharacterized protein with NAD-binding domain and iron-sulfur cluster